MRLSSGEHQKREQFFFQWDSLQKANWQQLRQGEKNWISTPKASAEKKTDLWSPGGRDPKKNCEKGKKELGLDSIFFPGGATLQSAGAKKRRAARGKSQRRLGEGKKTVPARHDQISFCF